MNIFVIMKWEVVEAEADLIQNLKEIPPKALLKPCYNASAICLTFSDGSLWIIFIWNTIPSTSDINF